MKNLVGGRTYHFQVFANSSTNYGASDEVKFPVPARVKHKAITAGVVGGILFFIVAIILSICAVKICNKRKRRKQEKGMNPEIISSFQHIARLWPAPVLQKVVPHFVDNFRRLGHSLSFSTCCEKLCSFSFFFFVFLFSFEIWWWKIQYFAKICTFTKKNSFLTEILLS